MDTISVIALAGSVVGIIDVATRSVGALRKLQERWKAADLTVSLLIGQLTTLKAALDQIAKWISTSLAEVPQHHQLVIDLGAAIQSCELLLSFLDGHLSKLERDASDRLNFESRVKVVMKDCDLKEYANRLSNQATAMNLLLTALNCHSMSEQRDLLECSKSRRILDQIKDDSSSLFCLRDSASFCNSLIATTERSSMLSRNYEFDAEIVNSKVYKGQMRSLMRRAIGKSRQATNTDSVAKHRWMEPTVVGSTAIDKSIALERKVQGTEVMLLLLGHRENEKSLFLNTMRMACGDGYSPEGRKAAKKMIYLNIYRTMVSVLEEVKASGRALLQAHDSDIIVLQSHGIDDGHMPVEVARAIYSLWKDPAVRQSCSIVIDNEYRDSIIYFLDSFPRIAQPDYVPNDSDMARCCFHSPRLEEVIVPFIVPLGKGTYRIVKPVIRSESKTLLPLFENFPGVIFLADLSNYNEAVEERQTLYGLNESLLLFDRTCNSRWLRHTPVVLFLTNSARFKAKLAIEPLQHYFPDYEGGADDEAAQCYISGRFKSIREPIGVHCRFMDADDIDMAATTMTCVQDVLIGKNLKIRHVPQMSQ